MKLTGAAQARSTCTPPFAREQAIYRAEGRRSLSRVERWVPGCFSLLHAAMLATAALR